MNAAPGWYDAGTPGRVRWWDGTQWTAHEADAPAAVAASAPPQHIPLQHVPPQHAPTSSAPAQPSSAPVGPAPGWYVTPAGPARWWDGRKWTGLRFRKDGTPGTDWGSTEQVGFTWALGVIFLALASVQLVLGMVTPGVSFAGFPLLLVAALWFGIAIQTTIVLRIPVPASAPLMLDIVRPFPGEQEGPGAGWYPITGTASRWWTGARWAEYTNSRFGIRPTFHAARSLAALRATAIGVFALAALVVVVGIVFIVISTNDPGNYVAVVVGWVMAIGGVLFAGLGATVIAMNRYQARLLLPPSEPPRAWLPPAAPARP